LKPIMAIFAAVVLSLCSPSCSLIVPAGGNGSVDVDTDVDTDADTDTDSDSDGGTDCTPAAYQQCVGGEVHSFDSCGADEGAVTTCTEHASCVDLTETTAACQCDTGWASAPACDACDIGFSGGACENAIVHVDGASTAAAPDGKSWETAFPSILGGTSRACDLVDQLETVGAIQVWVAAGVYSVLTTARTDAVQLCGGVQLLGGFAGDETVADARDPETNRTTLDGDGVYHVVIGAPDTLIDGFGVTGGDADGSSAAAQDTGAGVYVPAGASLTASRLRVFGNGADASGGGIAVVGSLALSDSFVTSNASGDGGGLAVAPADETSAIEISRTVFSMNEAARGGGVFGTGAPLGVHDSVFEGNTANDAGGGIALADGSSLTGENLLVLGNTATSAGGGIDADATSTLQLGNSTIWRNGVAGASPVGAGVATANGAGAAIVNSIIWWNTNASWTNDDIAADTLVNLTYSATSADDYFGLAGVIGDTSYTNWVGFRAIAASTYWAISSAEYDAGTDTTTIRLAGDQFAPHELVGAAADLAPWDSDFRLSYITDNDEGSLVLAGDMSESATVGNVIGLYDPRLSPLSPCIDVGDDSAATAIDLGGASRYDVFGRGAGGTLSDIGAYESAEMCVRTVHFYATGAEDGLTWDTAFKDIQNGVDGARAAIDGSGGAVTSCEVWVSNSSNYGIFSLAAGATVTQKSLHLRPGVSMYGSFQAPDTVDKARRTLLFVSGTRTNLAGTDSILGSVQTVVTASGLDGGEVFDGFNVMGGAGGSAGGGMLIQNSSMRVVNSQLWGNSADTGGGVYLNAATASFENCSFVGNQASSGAGGAIYSDGSSALTVEGCALCGNSAHQSGGSISTASGGAISDSVFAGNSVTGDFGGTVGQGYGGAIDVGGGALAISNAALVGNSSPAGYSGAIGVNDSASASIVDVTSYANTAAYGYTVAQIGATATVTIANSVLWNDTPMELQGGGISGLDFSYSDISGLTADATAHTYNADPGFAVEWSGTVSGQYSSESYSYIYADVGSSPWTNGAWVGDFAVIANPGGTHTFPIYMNDSSSIYVVGDLNLAGVAAGDTLELLSLRPDGASVCVDTGDDAIAPAADILGDTRFDYAGAGDTGTVTDLGAYEALPPE
jgi:hypothetical protein